MDWSDYINKLKWRLFGWRLVVEDQRSRAFDKRYNVETAREEPLGEMGIPTGDVERGNGVYRVTWGWLIEKALAQLNVDFGRYTFIDYGFEFLKGKWKHKEYDSFEWDENHDETNTGEIKDAI